MLRKFVKILLFAIFAIFAIFTGCDSDRPAPVNRPDANSSQSPAPTRQPEVTVPQSPAQPPVADEQIVAEIKRIVSRTLNLDVKDIDDKVPLSKQKVAADELDVVEIVMGIEESFNVEIKDDEIGGSDPSEFTKLTIGKLAEIVARKKQVK